MRLSLEPRQRWIALAAIVALAASAGWLGLQVETSRPLTAAEAAQLGLWVELTGEPAVTRAYIEQREDGQLTVDEARRVMEVAKARPPEFGLASSESQGP